MAKKKAAARSMALVASADTNAEAILVQDAYGDAVKGLVQVLINNYIDNDPTADKRFTTGLAIVRKARDRALVLVQS